MALADYLGKPGINECYRIYFSSDDGMGQCREEVSRYYEYLKSEEGIDAETAYGRRNRRACIIRYSPGKIDEKSEKAAMLHLLSEYLPADINDGLIPYDMAERRKMYAKAFKEFIEE